jgi:tetratricopeptide (TPR) repeat protein
MFSSLKYVFILIVFIFLTNCPSGSYIKITKTIEELQAALKEDPNDPVAYYNLGLWYTAEKQYQSALDHFHKALEIEPHASDAYFAIYCVEYAKDKKLYDKALEKEPTPEVKEKIYEISSYLNSAIMYDPFFDWKLSTILLDTKPSAHGNPYLAAFIDAVYYYLLDGFIQFRLGNYERAVKKLDLLIQRSPEYTQAYLVRGFAKMQLAQYEEAINDFRFVIEEMAEYNEKMVLPIYINPAELYYIIGCIHLKDGNLDKAEETFKKVIMENMGFYMAHYRLSNIHEQRGNNIEALKELDAAIIAKPDDAVFHFSKGICLNTMNRDWEAMQEYMEAISIKPNYPMPYYALAIVFESVKNKEAALENYKFFIDKAPKRLNTFIEKAQIRIDTLEREQNLQKN